MTANDRRILAGATALAVVGVVALGAGALASNEAGPPAATAATTHATVGPAVESTRTAPPMTNTTPSSATTISSTSTTTTSSTSTTTTTTSTSTTTTTTPASDPSDQNCVALTEIAEQIGIELGSIEAHELNGLIGDDGDIDNLVATLLALRQCVSVDLAELMRAGVDPGLMCEWLPELQEAVDTELEEWVEEHDVELDIDDLVEFLDAKGCDS